MTHSRHAAPSLRKPAQSWLCATCTPGLYDQLGKIRETGGQVPDRLQCPWCLTEVSYKGGRMRAHRDGGDICRGSHVTVGVAWLWLAAVKAGKDVYWLATRAAISAPAVGAIPDAEPVRAPTSPWTLKLVGRRKNLNMTQERVAREIGMTGDAFGRYESGRNIPPIDSFIRWAEVLGYRITIIDRHRVAYPIWDRKRLKSVLRSARIELGHMKQLDLARVLDVSAKAVQAWETGTYMPTTAMLLHWITAVRCKFELRMEDA